MKQFFNSKKNSIFFATLLMGTFLFSSCAHRGVAVTNTNSSAMDNQLEDSSPAPKKVKSYQASSKKVASRGIASVGAARRALL
jgi:uncharacterized protein YycO